MIIRLYQKFLFIGLLITLSINLSAQTVYKTAEDKSEITIIPQIDRAALANEDAADKESGAPIRAAILYPLVADTGNSGIWSELSNSNKKWILTITTPDSYGVIVRYSDFYIPQGGKLYVYNKDYPENTVVYTNEDNIDGGPYSTEVTDGDQITLEYVGPSSGTKTPHFEISEIGYKYRALDNFDSSDNKLKGFNDAANTCMININCTQGDDWQKQKKGVVRIISKIGSQLYYCSGSLVNNTNKDKTPYVLSACHCFNTNGMVADMPTTEYWFDYEFSGCENETARPETKRIIGAESLVFNPLNGGSDGALVKLSKSVDSDWDVYYNGWNVESRDNIITNGAVIHHPQGDVKKITLYSNSLRTASWSANGEVSTPNAHWVISYSEGVTEGGSSGAPIFDQNGLIVGTLTGGSSSCKNISNNDYYAKFAYNWDKSTDTNLQMKKYLDPDNKGVTQLAGWDGIASEIILEEDYANLNITDLKVINILSGNGDYTVTSSDPTIASATIEDDAKINITAINEGNAIITVQDRTGNQTVVTVTVNSIIADSTAPSIYAWWKNLGVSNDKTTLSIRAKDETNVLKKIRVINLSGYEIFKETGFTNYYYDIDTSVWQKGVYILIVNAGNISRTFKVIK